VENSAVVAKCFEVIAKLTAQEKLPGGFRVITNSGPDAGQSVPHLHFHVMAGKNLGAKLCTD
jgi:histidine triad (HIT) family protein